MQYNAERIRLISWLECPKCEQKGEKECPGAAKCQRIIDAVKGMVAEDNRGERKSDG